MPLSHTKARALYDSGAPVAQVAAVLGLKPDAFRRFRKKRGWPLRPSPIAKRAAPPPPVAAAEPHEGAGEAPAKAVALRRRLSDMTNDNLTSVQKSLASGSTKDIERNARVLASLVKTLSELRRLEELEPRAEAPREAGDDDDEPPPRDIETLRAELARALERLSADAGGPQAGG